jgi:hypothetical protein
MGGWCWLLWLKVIGICGDLPDEARKRYSKKPKYNHEGSMDPYELTSEWLYDPSVCMDLPVGDIYGYMIESPAWSVHQGQPESL